MRISKKQIIKAIGYEKVTEYINEDYHRFDILPDDESLPKAYLVFSIADEGYFLLQAGFGDWHDHFDSTDNEEENIKEALAFFNNLIAGKCYMIKKVDERGKYLGGSIAESQSELCDHAPLSLSFKEKNTRLLKVVFNKPCKEYRIEDT